jgi:PAS domain S-box-containing protein
MATPATRESAELLEGQNRVLELIAQGSPLPTILDLLLGVIQAQCPGMLCSILLLDPDGIHVRHCAARGLPEAFIRSVDGEPIGPRAGSCGTAAFRHEPVIVEDIATDPLWDRYRELALRYDLRAGWSTPIFDSERRVLGTFAMYFRAPGGPDARHLRLIDISTHVAAIAIARHQRVEALRASEERLRLALSGGSIDIWEYDVETARLRWHGGLKVILSLPGDIEDLTLKTLLDAIHPEDRQNVETAFRASLSRNSGHDIEFRVVHPDGSLHWFVSKGSPECDSTGKAVRMRGIALEVTERKRAEEEIRRREAQLVEAQRIARLGSYEWDLRANIVRRSEELYRIFGLLPHEFEPTYDGYLARVHPEDRSTTKELIDRSFQDGQPFDFEERIVRPDGSIQTLHSQGQWSLDDNQLPVKLVGICQDITERKQVEQELRAANAALAGELNERMRAEKEIRALTARLITAQEEERTRIARELHDDLSQQIATLSIAASNLKKNIAPEDAEARVQSERIQQKLVQLAEGIRRLSHNLHPAVLEHSGLGAALRSYASEFSTLTGITILFRAEGSFERLPVSVALCLYRIAQEALQNVLKHARVDHAELAITGSSGSVSLTVSDEGAGIDALRASMPQGLGLVNIKERTRLVNGTLSITSQPNQGTTLNVMVPISDGA